MGAPFRANLANVTRARPLSLAVRASNRVLNSEVELRQYVATAKSEHQEHLCRPASDSLHLYEMLDELVIMHVMDTVEWEFTRQHFVREVTKVADLLPRQSDAAERVVGKGEQRHR